MRASLCIATLTAAAAAAAPSAAQDTVRFEPTVAQPTFAVREPVLRIRPKTVLVSRTHFGPYYTAQGGAFPGEVGPIYVEGATTSDMLVVRVRRVRPNHDLAAAQLYRDFGGLATESRVRLLNDPIPARRYLWRLDRARGTATTDLPDSRIRRVEVDLRPMLGRVAVAPRGQEAFGGIWPGDFGGNMDAPEVREGATVYLPIFHDGAYLYFGDGHARQGQGEVAGTGLETSMDVVLEIDVVKGKAIDWPRIEDDDHIMVVGAARPLIDAFRLAHVELIEWLVEEYGFGKWDAYALVGQVGESSIANIVDPLYTAVAKFPKRFLPASPERAADDSIRRVLADYTGLYTRETLDRWRTLFLPSFAVASTNPDGTTTLRTFEEFFAAQKRYHESGRIVRERLENVRIERQGRLATVLADFVLTEDRAERRGKLVLLLMQERGSYRIHSLMFTYHG
jgi:amidase